MESEVDAYDALKESSPLVAEERLDSQERKTEASSLEYRMGDRFSRAGGSAGDSRVALGTAARRARLRVSGWRRSSNGRSARELQISIINAAQLLPLDLIPITARRPCFAPTHCDAATASSPPGRRTRGLIARSAPVTGPCPTTQDPPPRQGLLSNVPVNARVALRWKKCCVLRSRPEAGPLGILRLPWEPSYSGSGGVFDCCRPSPSSSLHIWAYPIVCYYYVHDALTLLSCWFLSFP